VSKGIISLFFAIFYSFFGTPRTRVYTVSFVYLHITYVSCGIQRSLYVHDSADAMPQAVREMMKT
jgi:hypothetical protein